MEAEHRRPLLAMLSLLCLVALIVGMKLSAAPGLLDPTPGVTAAAAPDPGASPSATTVPPVDVPRLPDVPEVRLSVPDRVGLETFRAPAASAQPGVSLSLAPMFAPSSGQASSQVSTPAATRAPAVTVSASPGVVGEVESESAAAHVEDPTEESVRTPDTTSPGSQPDPAVTPDVTPSTPAAPVQQPPTQGSSPDAPQVQTHVSGQEKSSQGQGSQGQSSQGQGSQGQGQSAQRSATTSSSDQVGTDARTVTRSSAARQARGRPVRAGSSTSQGHASRGHASRGHESPGRGRDH